MPASSQCAAILSRHPNFRPDYVPGVDVHGTKVAPADLLRAVLTVQVDNQIIVRVPTKNPQAPAADVTVTLERIGLFAAARRTPTRQAGWLQEIRQINRFSTITLTLNRLPPELSREHGGSGVARAFVADVWRWRWRSSRFAAQAMQRPRGRRSGASPKPNGARGRRKGLPISSPPSAKAAAPRRNPASESRCQSLSRQRSEEPQIPRRLRRSSLHVARLLGVEERPAFRLCR